jgi:SAM-dependent methyltransferase
MFSHVQDVIETAEEAAKHGTVNDVLGELRRLSLDDFGALLLEMPSPEFAGISRLLPKMAAEEVQKHWTGGSGHNLLKSSLSFVRSVALQCVQITGAPISEKSILDFGCGYGRIMRLMYYYSAPSRIWGVDPSDQALNLCRSDRMLGNFAMSDYLPTELPVGDARFGLIYAFSVFTHLSERATRQALTTLRRYIENDGLCVITIRPKEYWGFGANFDLLKKQHDDKGFAFAPHNGIERCFAAIERALAQRGKPPIDADITYGDTSMTFRWLSVNIPEWKIASYDHTLDDILQVVVYLTPR